MTGTFQLWWAAVLILAGCDGRNQPCCPQGPGDTGTGSTCGEGWNLDGDECVPQGCGVGTWGGLEVDTSTVYVDIAAAAGGDGSEGAPFTSIQAGLNAAGQAGGGMVAVARGSYSENLEIGTDHADVHLAGRCQELVVLDGVQLPTETPVIAVGSSGAAATLSGLTISGAGHYGISVSSGRVTLFDITIADSRNVGIFAYQSGIMTTTLLAESCTIAGTRGLGIVADRTGTEVTIRDSTIRDTRPDEEGRYGYGAYADDGARLVLEHTFLHGNHVIGLVARDSRTTVIIRDSTIQDTQPDEDGQFGYGAYARNGARLMLEHTILHGNHTHGLVARDSDTRVSIRDSTIEDTVPDEDGRYGYGVYAAEGSELLLERTTVDGNKGFGLFAVDSSTTVTLTDSTITNTTAIDDNDTAAGVVILYGAWLQADGLFAAANEGPGLLIYDAGTAARCDHCLLEENRFAGAAALEGAALDLSNSLIQNNVTNSEEGGGYGVYAATYDDTPPTLLLTGNIIEGNLRAGVWMLGEGRYEIDSNIIRNTKGDPEGGDELCGDGILAMEEINTSQDATGLRIIDNVITNSDRAGILLHQTTGILQGNTYSDNEVDVIVQGTGQWPVGWDEAGSTDVCVYCYQICADGYWF